MVYIPADNANGVECRMYPLFSAGLEPPEPVGIIAPVRASSPAQAKYLYVREEKALDYPDDWPALRVRLLAKDVDGKAGIVEYPDPDTDRLWGRIHEVEDHGGKSCDCPEDDS